MSHEFDETALFAYDTTELGSPKIVDGRLEWVPPAHLNAHQIDAIKESLNHINTCIARGDLEIRLDPDGKIKVTSKGKEE